jgi:hypothetical protein
VPRVHSPWAHPHVLLPHQVMSTSPSALLFPWVQELPSSAEEGMWRSDACRAAPLGGGVGADLAFTVARSTPPWPLASASPPYPRRGAVAAPSCRSFSRDFLNRTNAGEERLRLKIWAIPVFLRWTKSRESITQTCLQRRSAPPAEWVTDQSLNIESRLRILALG